MRAFRHLAVTLLAAALALPAGADTGGAHEAPAAVEVLDPQSAFELSQAAIGGQVRAHRLTDQNGAALDLDALRGKPLVISLIFTACSTVCPITTDHLRDSVIEARRALGPESFAVLTFGFDASGDKPAQLASFGNTHRLRGIPEWYLASADPATTETLLAELGFSWRSAAGGFDHVTQTSILDAEGKVYRQVYGEAFPLPVLMEPLKELVLGTHTRSFSPEDLWNRLTFLCTVYNPLTAAYRFDYGIFFGIALGGLSLILTGIVIFRLWLGNRRAARRALREQS